MLYILFALFFLTPVFFGWGFIFRKTAFSRSVSGYIFNGIFIITVLWSILAFFFPMNSIIEFATCLIGLFAFFKWKLYLEFFKVFRTFSIAFYLSALLIILTGSIAPSLLDNFYYYIPTINWIKSMGWVNGLANLNWIFGQTSFWHLLEAGFSHFSDTFFRLNTLLLIYFLFYAEEKKQYILYLLIPVFMFFSQSPSPDLPVILLSVILLFEIFSGNKNYAALFAFSAFVFAIKPTVIWLPLLVIFYIISDKQIKLKYFLPGILVGLIYIIKNIWISGIPLFPTTLGAFIDFPWKVTPERLTQSMRDALMFSYESAYPYEYLKNASFPERMKLWFSLPAMRGTVNMAFILLSAVFSIFCLLKKERIWSLILIALLIKILFVILFSAQLRFYVDAFLVMGLLMIKDILNQKHIRTAALAGIAFVFAALAAPKTVGEYLPVIRSTYAMKGFEPKNLIKPGYYINRRFEAINIGNVEFFLAKDSPYVFDTDLPGISMEDLNIYRVNGFLPQYQNAEKKNSFYPEKLTEEQKQQILEIFKENGIKLSN